MQSESILFVRVVFTGLFLLTLLGGIYLMKNYQRFFGADPNLPSENESARAYHKVQVFTVWAHAVLLTGAFALLFR